MKFLNILFMSFIILVTNDYTSSIRKIDNIVYSLYEQNFEEFVVINNNLEIEYDKNKIKEKFSKDGYKVKFFSGILSFEVSHKGIFNYKKKYSFSLGENNEIK